MQTLALQEIISALADAARDYVPGETTAASGATNMLTDATKAGRRPNHWQNSEIIFCQPGASAAGMAGSNPFVVAAYNDGIFTLDHDFGPAGVPQGLEYYIVRNHGQGNPYRSYLNAVRRALDNLGYSDRTIDNSLVTAAGTYDYTIPATLDTVYAVELSTSDYGPYQLAADRWQLLPGRKLRLADNTSVDWLWGITLYGRKFSSMPDDPASLLTVDLDDVVDFALEFLNRTSNRQVDQVKGQSLQAERIRFKRRHALPNERRII